MAVTPLRHEQSDEEHARPFLPMLMIGLRILNERALLWAVSLGAIAGWTFTVLHPEPWRIVTAVGYSLTVMLPVLGFRRRRGGDD